MGPILPLLSATPHEYHAPIAAAVQDLIALDRSLN